MRKMWAAGAAIVLCLALGGVPVVGQDETEPVASLATSPAPAPMVPAMVTGEFECFDRANCEERMSDPRVNGVHTPTMIREIDVPGANGFVAWGSLTIPGPDGDWTGPFFAMAGWDFSPVGRMVRVLEGTGAYEGWTYVSWPVTYGTERQEVEGMIYKGPPPQMAVGQDEAKSASTSTLETAVPMAPAMVTGELECFDRANCEERMSDPRVNGVHTPTLVREIDVPGANGYVVWATATIPGPDGDWTGPFFAMAGWDYSPKSRQLRVLEGTGAYEGWTYVSWPISHGTERQEVEGMIYKGPPPQLVLPEPVESAE
ncbi:MAG: hypothetical protein PVG27_12135 [Chloroflexota bacterium]|jgi:hypothetical protein